MTRRRKDPERMAFFRAVRHLRATRVGARRVALEVPSLKPALADHR